LNRLDAPILGTLISVVAAALFLGSSLGSAGVRNALGHSPPRGLLWFALAGLAVNTAHLFRYWALSYGPVSIVVPLMRTSPVFTLLFAFMFNRKLETLDRYTVAGVLLVVVGAIALFY